MKAEAAAKGLKIEVRYPDGKTEQLVVDADTALIGCGAHCEVRLSAEQAAVEHVGLSVVGSAVQAQAFALEMLPTINGTEFMKTPVLPGSVIGIGDVKLRVELVDVEGNTNVIRKRGNKTSPLTYVLALLALPMAFYLILGEGEEESHAPPPKEVPVLWGEPIRTCPQTAQDQALAFAFDRKILADAKRERRPFHVQDGVEAVPLFETASACFRLAGKDDLATDLFDSATLLRKQIGEDYRAHQMRLEHALSVEDFSTAQKEVRVLRALTEKQNGPYVVWLSNLQRRLTVQMAQSQQKKS